MKKWDDFFIEIKNNKVRKETMNKIKRAALCIIVISVVFGIKLSNKETDVSAKQTLFCHG